MVSKVRDFSQSEGDAQLWFVKWFRVSSLRFKVLVNDLL